MSNYNYSAQGSLSIKRLRTGDSLFVSLNLEGGIPLFQGVDPDSGAVTPDWTKDNERPIIAPRVTSSIGNAVTLSNHNWYYEDTLLVFTGATENGFVADSRGQFALDMTSGRLKIIDNLASAENKGSDNLRYMGKASVGGVEYSVSKDIEVVIQPMGSSAYAGFVTASDTQLESTMEYITLSTELWHGTGKMTNYYVRWFKDNEEWVEKKGQKAAHVTHDDVNGSQVFIAEFYLSQTDTSYVDRFGIQVIDVKDEYRVKLLITSANKDVDSGSDVTVAAQVVNTTTGAQVEMANPSWTLTLMDGDKWKEIRHVDTNTITITTADTDVTEDGVLRLRDVEVIGEVTW